MSKAVKTIVGVAASIAIPFAAPAIAGAIGTSLGISAATLGMSTTVGSVLGSASVGAALGGATQAVLGGDVRQGMLMGAIGGGIGGYTTAPAAPSQYSVVGGTPAAGTAGAGATSYPVTTQPVPVSYDLAAPSTGLSGGMGGGGVGLQAPTTFGGTQAGLAGAGGPTGFTGVEYSLASGAQFPTAGLNPTNTGVGLAAGTPPVGLQVASGSPVVGGTQGAAGATPTGRSTTFAEAVSRIPGEIAAKFNDPKTLADLTLRAAGSLVAGDGLSDEERSLLATQTEELRNLQQTNASLFAQRLDQAQNLIGESKYFDPEYFGLQRARRAQTAAAHAKRAGLRGLEGASREAESRRFDLTTARDVGTSYDQGYLAGVQGRLGTMQAGMQMMPTGFPSSMGDYTNLRGAYGAAATRARETQRDIGDLFGSLTGGQRSQSRGG